MEEGALLRLDADRRLDAKEGRLQDLVEASFRRQGSIAKFNFAFHRSNVALKAESGDLNLGVVSKVSRHSQSGLRNDFCVL